MSFCQNSNDSKIIHCAIKRNNGKLYFYLAVANIVEIRLTKY